MHFTTPDKLLAKLDALYSLMTQTLSTVQAGGGGGGGQGGGRAFAVDITPRNAPPKPVDAGTQMVADSREAMLAELRATLEKRRRTVDAEAETALATAR
jgi:hypothetical protein